MGGGMTRRYSPPLTGGVLQWDGMRVGAGATYWTLRIVLASDQCFSRP
ncbi:MAG: hypothetical protein QOE66_1869 [Chloroflexota bacterium]|jgi:hypothetical protein|nr:hypothetical protein [Chloroflexota bacterium]